MLADFACSHCRDCGVFPGTGSSWASCLCDAGRLRCTFSSDAPSEVEGDLESGYYPVGVRLNDHGKDARKLHREFRRWLPGAEGTTRRLRRVK